VFIHTVYKSEENVDYLKDWLVHHSLIGIEHFYMYDNSGAHDYPYDPSYIVPSHTNKYGELIKYTVEEAREKQQEIFKEFPVTVIPWQNRDANGKLLYYQKESIIHFSQLVKKGLCAFIDIDEFIIKKENFRVSRMNQRKFKARHHYSSVHDCHEYFDVDTTGWGTKVILDMANFPSSNQYKNIHFVHLDLPASASYFNHYNHCESAHQWLIMNGKNIDPDYNNIYQRLEDTELKKKI